MLRATTLVHKGAMEMGVHSIRSFVRHFAKTHTLTIHTDTSTDENDHRLLLEAASGIEAKIVTSKDRGEKLTLLLDKFPETRNFLNRASYFAKLELPMVEEAPYFFFDSDIIFLRHIPNLVPANSPNAFSTESWSWYNGITNEKLWIAAKTPRRVNSGFHHLGQKFPFQKMEEMLCNNMFDRSIPFASDQEIFAYLYNDMEYYHPEDLKRSRVGIIYNLADETCAALHFPGKMWRMHLDQINQLPLTAQKPPVSIRYQHPVPLTLGELFRMRTQVRMSQSGLLKKPLALMRKLRKAYK